MKTNSKTVTSAKPRQKKCPKRLLKVTAAMRKNAANFQAQVESVIAFRKAKGGFTKSKLAKKIGRTKSSLSWALREPWIQPLTVKAIEKELFEGREVYQRSKAEASK